MATEVLHAITDPLSDYGTTTFAAATLVHKSRILTAHLSGTLFPPAPVFDGGINPNNPDGRDYVRVTLTTNGGIRWTFLTMATATDGVSMLNEDLGPISVDATCPISSIQVRLMTGTDMGSNSQLSSIILTCSEVEGPSYSFGSLMGF